MKLLKIIMENLIKWKRWEDFEVNFLKENYPLKGANFCSEKLKISLGRVKRKIQYLKLTLNTDIKKEFFMKGRKKMLKTKLKNRDEFIKNTDWNNFLILNDETIYLLGYIWADGHISKRKNKKNWNFMHLIFEIHTKDAKNIEKNVINKFGYDKKFGKYIKQDNMTNFHIFDWKIGYFLMLHDYHNKSYSQPIKILNLIPKNKHYLFYRGYTDGDGCIYWNKHHFSWSVSSRGDQNWNFLKKKFKEMSLNFRIDIDRRELGTTSSFVSRTKKDALNFCKYIYKNREKDEIGLHRKYKKYLLMLNQLLQKTAISSKPSSLVG